MLHLQALYGGDVKEMDKELVTRCGDDCCVKPDGGRQAKLHSFM